MTISDSAMPATLVKLNVSIWKIIVAVTTTGEMPLSRETHKMVTLANAATPMDLDIFRESF